MVDNASDRRKFARLDLALTVSYRILDRGAPDFIDPREAMSSDVSLGGLRLMTPGPIPNGTRLALEIFTGEEGTHPISAEGEVVWQNRLSNLSYETGVMIKAMPNSEKKRFMEFVFDQMAKVVA